MDGPGTDMLGNGRADFGQEKESQWKYRGHDRGLNRGMPLACQAWRISMTGNRRKNAASSGISR